VRGRLTLWSLSILTNVIVDDYIRSVTAAQRRSQGASGSPNVPAQTAARLRAGAKPATEKTTVQTRAAAAATQQWPSRHQDDRDTSMTDAKLATVPYQSQYPPMQPTDRHQDFSNQPQNYSQQPYQQQPYSGNYVQPVPQRGNRHDQAFVNVTTLSSYSLSAAQRQASPQLQPAGLLSPMEERLDPSASYGKEEDPKPVRPSQPSSGGTQGWNMNPRSDQSRHR
jgi:hypothetical protein